MTLTAFDGTITTTSSEQNLFDRTGTAHYATYIYLHNMTATETVVIKVYLKDVNATTMRALEPITLTGVQSDPVGYIAYHTAAQYKVTIQRTGGSDRAFTWLRYEVT